MLTAFVRTIILYFLIMAGLRLTGKRQIADLEPSELVLTMMISDLAAIPMQDAATPIAAGILPIVTLLCISMLLSQLSLQSLWLRALVCGKPAILIRDGVLQQEALRKNRYTVDELLEELRGQGYGDLTAVKYAVLENSGRLSVLPWSAEQPPTAKQLKLHLKDETVLPTILISDGRIRRNNLKACGKTESFVLRALQKERISSPNDVFLLLVDEHGNTTCIKKEGL